MVWAIGSPHRLVGRQFGAPQDVGRPSPIIIIIIIIVIIAHSASTRQVPQTSTVWFYCRAIYYGCHISLEIVGRVTPKF